MCERTRRPKIENENDYDTWIYVRAWLRSCVYVCLFVRLLLHTSRYGYGSPLAARSTHMRAFIPPECVSLFTGCASLSTSNINVLCALLY